MKLCPLMLEFSTSVLENGQSKASCLIAFFFLFHAFVADIDFNL